NGIIKANPTGGRLGDYATFTFNHLPAGSYDVYLYTCMNGDGVRANYWDAATNTTYYVTLQHTFNDGDTFVQGTNTDPNSPNVSNVCNYVKFTNLSPDAAGHIGIVADHVSGADGLGVSGFQLVSLGPPLTTVTILKDPDSHRVLPGDTNVVLQVGTWGPVASWQWYKNNNLISGANGPTYAVPAVQVADNGAQFQVVVTS